MIHTQKIKAYLFNRYATIAGGIVAFCISIYAARPWGNNYAYQDLSGYLSLAMWELWIALPFIILYFLNQKYGARSFQKKILLFSVLVICVFGNYIYIDAVFINISSTSALIFIFLPLYKLLFISVIFIICAAKK